VAPVARKLKQTRLLHGRLRGQVYRLYEEVQTTLYWRPERRRASPALIELCRAIEELAVGVSRGPVRPSPARRQPT